MKVNNRVGKNDLKMEQGQIFMDKNRRVGVVMNMNMQEIAI